VAWACGQARVAELVVLARRAVQARSCARLAGSAGRSAQLETATLKALSAQADLVVNSLPGEPLGHRFGSALAPGKGWAIDISYTPTETAFGKQAKRRGWRFSNGVDMLLEQGILAFEWWFKKPAPRSQMAAALRKV
jgi:shikimate dehydrogenase